MLPFANESETLKLGGLTIENRTDLVALYGDLDITRDKVGLELARRLYGLLGQVVAALEADASLPEVLPPPAGTDTVANPF